MPSTTTVELMEGYRNTSAVVTGASSGIGRAIAIALAASGVRQMVIHYRHNHGGAQQTVDAIGALGCQGSVVAADSSQAVDRQRLVDTAFERLVQVQTWVNNAGADVLTGAAATLDFEAKLRRLLEVDVVGTIGLSRLVVERLEAQRLEAQRLEAQRSKDPRLESESDTLPPSMVFIGWDQSPHGMEGDAGQMFGPVKAAVMAFAASLAQDVAPHVRVNTIAPGWIQTSWGQTANEYWSQRARGQALMNRWGQPEDIARAVVYVADPENTFLTGQTIDLNGGWNRKPTAEPRG